MNIVVIFGMIALLLSGCTPNEQMEKSSSAANQEINTTDAYEVFIEKEDYTYAKYEPQSGCYLGVDTEENMGGEDTIDKFESLVGTEHQIYVKKMKIGELYPLQWVLECYSKGKMPMITMYPYDNYGAFDKKYIEQSAKDFGMIDVPIFVQLLPNPVMYGVKSEDYVEYFRFVRESFKQNAPNVAFVWSIDRNVIKESEAFYPGDDFVDWVGLNVFDEIGKETENDIWKQLDYYYYSFQKRKPLMISQLGISHYSTKNHSYQIEEASIKIEDFYNKIQQNYPRIKAIVYVNQNNIDKTPLSAVRSDFTVTGDTNLIASYERAIEGEYFGEKKTKGIELFKSPFPGFVVDEHIYISENTWKYDMEGKDEVPVIILNGMKFVELERTKTQVDAVKKKLFISMAD